jgi:hypothetical protein
MFRLQKHRSVLIDVTQAQRMMDSLPAQMDVSMRASVQQSMEGETFTAEQKAILEEMRGKMLKAIAETMQWAKFDPLSSTP